VKNNVEAFKHRFVLTVSEADLKTTLSEEQQKDTILGPCWRAVKEGKAVTYCLASISDEKMPSPDEYYTLKKASLGEKRLSFYVDESCLALGGKIKEAFPKLENSGGYVLKRGNSTCKLVPIIDPPYTIEKLKQHVGQAKIVITPLQRDLDNTPDVSDEHEKVICSYPVEL
jgi:hypothetical protein